MIKLKVTLIFLFAFSLVSAQEKPSRIDSITSYDIFSESISNSLQKDTHIIYDFIAIVVAIILFVILFEIYRSKKSRDDMLKIAWEKFDSEAKFRRLSSDTIALLRNIARKSETRDPCSLLRSPTVFEHCLSAMYEKDNTISNAKLSDIRNLRYTLGYLPLSKEIALVSTRQFERGEKCPIQIPDTGVSTHKGMAIFLNVNEGSFSVTRPDGPKVPEGTYVRMQFSRFGDAEYDFCAEVLEDRNGELVLAHAEKLSRSQLRNWVRVDVHIPVDIVLVAPDGSHGDFLKGSIIDMSGGGLGIALPRRLRMGQNLLLEFDLPGQGKLSNLLVKIVRVAGPFKNDTTKTIHSVAFDGEIRTLQEQIIQYVFEVQRREAQIRKN